MDNELKGRLIKWLDTVEGSIADAVDFGKEQAPQVIEELITYTIAIRSFYCIVSILLVFVPVVLVARAFKGREDETVFEVCDDNFPLIMFGGMSATFGAIVFCANVTTLLKAWIAPRVFVLEYIAELV